MTQGSQSMDEVHRHLRSFKIGIAVGLTEKLAGGAAAATVAISPARYKNVATPKRRDIRARLRPVDRWVSPLGRPSTTVRARLRYEMRNCRSSERSRWQLDGPRSRRGAARLQVLPKLGVADEFVLRQAHNRRILLVLHPRQVIPA